MVCKSEIFDSCGFGLLLLWTVSVKFLTPVVFAFCCGLSLRFLTPVVFTPIVFYCCGV